MATHQTTLLRRYQVLAAALMAAVVIIGIALAPVVGPTRTDRQGRVIHTHTPGAWMYVVILGLGVAATVVIHFVGYRAPAVPPGLDRKQTRFVALKAFQRGMVLRFALSETIAIVAIMLLLAGRSNTILPYVLAAAIALVLMAYHVWPSESLINRVQVILDRDGGRSDLANLINPAG